MLEYTKTNRGDTMLEKKDDVKKVYKSNKLIEARYKLTLTEQKILLYAASQIDKFTGDNSTILNMSVADFFMIAGLDEKSKNQKHIRKVAKDLKNKELSIEQPDGGWLDMNWLASSEYHPGKGIIELEFSQKMKPHLLLLKNKFSSYPLAEVMQLNSKYSIRLYELLIQWQYSSHKSLIMKVDELRKKMGLEDNEYERFDNFELWVIKKSIKELNEVSNITIDYEKIRVGRSVDSIKFNFHKKDNEKLEEIEVLQNLKDAGLANHIDDVKRCFNDNQLAFTDIEIDKAYMIVYNKLIGINVIQDVLSEAIYRYMLYYYEYTKHKAHNKAYSYYITCLNEDYGNIVALLKYSKDPNIIIYNKI